MPEGSWRTFYLALGLFSFTSTAILAEAPEGSDATERLRSLGIHVTSGAAPGYVDDRLCGRCHGDIARSYSEVGMARSFYRPKTSRDIEDFEANRFVHSISGNIYEMERRGDEVYFRQFQKGPDGEPINAFEQKVHWVLGSGHTSRTYLYQTESGEMFQLPLAWYTQNNSWGMAPGYDQQFHFGVTRPVRRECMFCHNAYPDVPEGSDRFGVSHVFPTELPEGTGCQRCHGPGAEHVALAFEVDQSLETVNASIVNPGRLAPDLRNDVCYGCHMQPSVALPGVRRFDRGDYSFRPGEDLGDYLVELDVEEEGRAKEDRFEINHHPYRLEQSVCFQESSGALSCLSCHDPHRKVPVQERAAHYREACLSCHQVDQCQLEEMAASDPTVRPPGIATDDCAGCHMPRRRTQDVVQVVMTDHRIHRRPYSPDLVAPREEEDPILVDVHLMDPKDAEGLLGEMFRAVAVIRAGGGENAVAHLEKVLFRLEPSEVEPWLQLFRGQLRTRRMAQAEFTLVRAQSRDPQNPVLSEWFGLVHAVLDRREAALGSLRKAVELEESRPEAHFNLGLLLVSYGRAQEALPYLERAIELRGTFAEAWLALGRARLQLKQGELAQEALRRSLAIDPTEEKAYLTLARSLVEEGRLVEAKRFLRHGTAAARSSQELRAALEDLAASNEPRNHGESHEGL